MQDTIKHNALLKPITAVVQMSQAKRTTHHYCKAGGLVYDETKLQTFYGGTFKISIWERFFTFQNFVRLHDNRVLVDFKNVYLYEAK